MTRLFPCALSASAIFGFLAMTPALAQVAGTPGDLRAQTAYSQQYKSLHGYTARVAAPESDQTGCGVVHDFNTSGSHYQYIAVCPLR